MCDQEYVADVSFKKRQLSVAVPKEGRTFKNAKVLAACHAAVKSKQAAFFDALDKRFAPNKIDWQVALDMLAYPDVPSHEADMPNFLKSDAAVKAFQAKLIGSDGPYAHLYQAQFAGQAT